MRPLHWIVAVLLGWLQREQHDVSEFLREENRVLKAQLHGRRLRLNDDDVGVLLSSDSALAAGSSRKSRRSSRPTRFSNGTAT